MYGRHAHVEEEELIKAVFALVKGRENGDLDQDGHRRNEGSSLNKKLLRR